MEFFLVLLHVCLGNNLITLTAKNHVTFTVTLMELQFRGGDFPQAGMKILERYIKHPQVCEIRARFEIT